MTRWTGTLRREGDGIVGTLTDAFGMVTTIRGTRSEAGYDLIAELTHVPDYYALPGDAGATHEVKRTPLCAPIKGPKPGKSTMLGDVCPDCHTRHDPPACGHDMGKMCPCCGKPFGLLTKRMSGDRCALCEIAAGNPT